jgi:hypothetical protein
MLPVMSESKQWAQMNVDDCSMPPAEPIAHVVHGLHLQGDCP